MRRELDNVEIKEPPITELKKSRSCLKRSCMSGCLTLVIIATVFLILLKMAATPKEKEFNKVPEAFPENIPLYDESHIERIAFLSAKESARAMELAAYVPKAIVVPLLVTINPELAAKHNDTSFDELSTWQKIVKLIREPVTDQQDQYVIEWRDLPADIDFIEAFFQTGLRREGFSITVTSKSLTLIQFLFEKDDITGTVMIRDIHATDDTDHVTLTTFVPTYGN